MAAARSAGLVVNAALALGVLGVVGCADDYEPNYLYRGEWIDIDGQGRSAEQTCGGTFAYVDAYAGALAREFGVEGQLGDYRWYSGERFDAELPCDIDVTGCAWDEGVAASPYIPLDHELVHLAEIAAVEGVCPSPLAEGLGEYYESFSRDVGADGYARVLEALAEPAKKIRYSSYGALGRFVAYLVVRFGLDAVLDVCRTSGRYPDAAQLSAAMEAVFGITTAQLLADFEPELGPDCDRGSDYQSRVFACGVAGAAPDIGLVEDEGVELRYELDCANERTIGPFIQDGRISIIERLDLAHDGDWLLRMVSDDADISDVTLKIAGCEPCSYPRVFLGEFIGPEPLAADRYWLEVSAPADFVGTVVVKIN